MSATTQQAEALFVPLLASLSREAQGRDVGIYLRKAAGPFVNNFTEGRCLSLYERMQWLLGKLTEHRIGRWESVTLAGLFPADFEKITAAAATLKKPRKTRA